MALWTPNSSVIASPAPKTRELAAVQTGMGIEEMKRTHARQVSAYLTPLCVWTLLRTMLLGCRLAALPTWQPASDGIKRHSEAVLVTMAPDDPRTLYLVTYELGGCTAQLMAVCHGGVWDLRECHSFPWP